MRMPGDAVAMTLDELAGAGLLDPGWAEALTPVAPDIAALGDRLRAEVTAGRSYLPAGDRVLRAFARPLDDVRVLIVGQDPYPTPGHPIGMSGARLVLTLAHELKRRGGGVGAAALCGGGGQGDALVLRVAAEG